MPSEELRENTELIQQGLRSALDHEFGTAIDVVWEVDATLPTGAAPATAPRRHRAAPVDDVDDVADTDEVVAVVDSVGEHLITEMFPGAEEVS